MNKYTFEDDEWKIDLNKYTAVYGDPEVELKFKASEVGGGRDIVTVNMPADLSSTEKQSMYDSAGRAFDTALKIRRES